MIYRARTVYPVTQPPIPNGAVWVQGSRIYAVGRWSEIAPQASSEAVMDLGERILMPGLVNAHCHLDYTMMRRAILPQTSFTGWIQRINALKRAFNEADYLQAIDDGFRELVQWGVTSVYSIESFPELLPRISRPPIRTWWFYELIDIRNRLESEGLMEGALSFFDQRPDWLGGFGLSPHAPFTASPALFRLAEACGQQHRMPLTTHLAESWDECRMFREGDGPLFDFVQGLGRDMGDCGATSPLRWFLNAGLDPRRWILAHLNEISEGDMEALGDHLSGLNVVHCPISHAYFRHRTFRASELAQRGANLCIGTDSLASAQSLNLFPEMRQFARQNPEFSAAAIVKMVTANPARALQSGSEFGHLSQGALADLICVADLGDDPAETIVSNRTSIEWMMVNGEEVSPSQ